MIRELHISRRARDRYHCEDSLFSLAGRVIIPNFQAARRLAQSMNERLEQLGGIVEPVRASESVRASDLTAMGLIEEILHYVLLLYREQKNPRVFSEAVGFLEERLPGTDLAYEGYLEEFPPTELYRQEVDRTGYLNGQTGGEPHRAILLEELVMLWLDNMNPAFRRCAELFDDSDLERHTAYRRLVHTLHDYFAVQEPFGPDGQNLLDMLRFPALASPDSLAGQLDAIRRHWGGLLGRYLLRILSALDFIREEERKAFGGPGPSRVYYFSALEGEAERFTPDRDWMPRLVMIARSTLVWLDQLSRRYGREVRRLDEIPDEELDRLAGWGFTGLWLIGIWERSAASRRIKQLTGNPEAASSAYSLFDYTVSEALGGEEAYRTLEERCRRRGIYLACDMVPNHTGLDSRWVREHPDWFIQLPYSPFPSYTFDGPNLCEAPGIGVFLEDHYYNRTDAAVVFKRVDFGSGEERYIYHGNDGTHMPWNDTAQLNYLNPEVREAVIQTILHVARRFRVIRFDAAMTLTHRHYQRLWFPEPGSGGDIPTRAEHGLSREEFRRRFPQEFWREVVDRVSREAPDTLLLAEAFWLMEGYFVRTLGMHRVYNSAFMNMLKREENAQYRQLIKNTLEFDPDILRRYANFMNNPDEETAVAQFGKGDKYFGVCLMMVTMPGLPMFGHGQIEGFSEKYGMEYSRAYWQEEPDLELIARHEREIFPLLRRRRLFAGVDQFRLYDFYTRDGVDENVFAWSNRADGDRALLVYNNRYESTAGWVRTSAAFLDKAGGRGLRQVDLAEGLGLARDDGRFAIFRDFISGLEYIRSSREIGEAGLYVELRGFGYQAFLDWREAADDAEGHYRQLHDSLGGRGVPSMDRELRRLLLRPVLDGLAGVCNGTAIQSLLEAGLPARSAGSTGPIEGPAGPTEGPAGPTEGPAGPTEGPAGLTEGPAGAARRPSADEAAAAVASKLVEATRPFLAAVRDQEGGRGETAEAVGEIRRGLLGLIHLLRAGLEGPPGGPMGELASLFGSGVGDSAPVLPSLLYCLVVLRPLDGPVGGGARPGRAAELVDRLMLDAVLVPFLQGAGLEEWEAESAVLLLKILLRHHDWSEPPEPRLARLLADPETRAYLKVNRYEGILWFNREAFESLLALLALLTRLDLLAEKLDTAAERLELLRLWQQAGASSGYRLDRLTEGSDPSPPRA